MLLPPLMLAMQLPTLHESNEPAPPSTRHEPLAAREALERCAAKLEDPSFEHATLLVAEQFDAAILSDSRNLDAIARSYSAFYRHTNVTAADRAAAVALPETERQAGAEAIHRAIQQCQALVARPSAHRPLTRALTAHTPLALADNSAYFHRSPDGLPYFPFGWNQGPAINGSLNSQLKAEMACGDCVPSRVYAAQPDRPDLTKRNWFFNNTVETIRATVDAGLQPILFLGHGRAPSKNAPTSHAMPQWALSEYPGLEDDAGNTHFCAYDIDNPGAKAVWNETFRVLLPAIFAEAMTDASTQPLLVSLANEPGWYSANSSYTLPKFEAFLRRRYKTIDAVNQAWGDTLRTFHDHELRDRMKPVKGLKSRQHLDWGQFNNARVTEWFLWLCNAAKAHAGSDGTNRIKCLVKASNGESPLGVGHPSGIDRVALSSGLDLNGCDTRAEFVTGQSHQSFPQLPTKPREAYAMDWIGMMGSYDFMASTTPNKLVVDYEWHGVSTVNFRAARIPPRYIHTALWLSHAHGLAANQIWMWGRNGWSGEAKIAAEFGGADFVYSVWTQPQLVDAYIRTSLELNSLSEFVVGLAASPRRVYLLYSASSAMMGDTAYIEQQLALYSLVAQLGVNVGFVSDSLPTCSVSLSCTLLIPCMTSISTKIVAALRKDLAGIHVLTAGNASVCTAAFGRDNDGETLTPADRQTVLSLDTIDIGPVAGATALATLENKLKPSLSERPIVCTDSNHSGSAVFGVHCRSALVGTRVALLVSNLLNHTVTVSLVQSGQASKLQLTFAHNGTEVIASSPPRLVLGSLVTVPLWVH